MSSQGKTCYLRRVTPEDVDLLFVWANDPEVRKNAFHSEPIPYEDHKRWFAGLLEDDTRAQYIMMDGEEAVGQIRFSLSGQTAVIDYSVAPDKRGRGFGRQLLLLAKEEVCREYPSIKALVGQVKPGNSASAKCFADCGYEESFRQFELKCGE